MTDEERTRYPTLFEIAVEIADQLRYHAYEAEKEEQYDIGAIEPGIVYYGTPIGVKYRLDVSVMFPNVSEVEGDHCIPCGNRHLYTDSSGVSWVHPRLYVACPTPECSDLKLLTKESKG
jgi:hypothetical protein